MADHLKGIYVWLWNTLSDLTKMCVCVCIRFTPNFDFILARDENKLEFPEPSGKETLQRWFLPSVRAPALFPPVLLSVTTYMLLYILERPLNIVDEFLLLLLFSFFFFLRNILALFKIKVSWNERTTSSEQKSHWKQKRRQRNKEFSSQ